MLEYWSLNYVEAQMQVGMTIVFETIRKTSITNDRHLRRIFVGTFVGILVQISVGFRVGIFIGVRSAPVSALATYQWGA